MELNSFVSANLYGETTNELLFATREQNHSILEGVALAQEAVKWEQGVWLAWLYPRRLTL